jgi:RNA ligase (TIGR02306 family)
MSMFHVSIERIERVWPHPGADRLDLATLVGKTFQLVVGRGQYRAGDEVVYFPIDAVLPVPVQEKLKVVGKLAGSQKNRVKTVRLRGEISQGIAGPLSLLDSLEDRAPEVITGYLGVTKYEAPEELELAGARVPLPEGQGPYDIEAAENFTDVVATLLQEQVQITEKVEGSNLCVSLCQGRVFVCQRNFAIEPIAGKRHVFWEVAERDRLIEFARALSGGQHDVRVYGELIGPKVQGNYYGVPTFRALLFDARVGDRWLPAAEFRDRARTFFASDAGLVPELAVGTTLGDWLAGRTLAAASEGKSQLADVAREGIVVRPLTEQFSPPLRSRLIIKQRSPTYLAESER